jgi:pilus assembly protein CpaB
MRPNSVIILFLAIVMGGIAAFLARNWIEGHSRALAGESVGTIVVAAQPLGFGAEVSPDSITEIPWVAKSLPEGAFTTKDDLLKDGRRVVLSPLGRGEPVLRTKITGPGQRALLSALLDEGKRAVTVRVDDVRGVAGFILPGDYVDVVLIAEDSPPRRENYSDILLQHVKVLAVDQLSSERQEQPTVAKAVTVEVSPEQAQKLLLATNIGKLSLILRRPEEANSDAGRRVTERDLGRIDPRTTGEVARPVLPPPPPPVAAAPAPPTNTVKVAIVRNNKREEYTVRRVDMSATAGE